MAYTRTQWATDFLHSIGNKNPTPNVVNWVVGWSAGETAWPHTAAYNLLNTTMNTPNVTGVFNSVGVKEYSNYAAGIEANAQTLENGNYSTLLSALQTNNEHALGFNAPSPAAGVMQNLNTWCGSCGYGNSFATSLLGQGANQEFAGTGSTIPTPADLTTSLQSFLPSCAANSKDWWCFPVTQGYGVPEANTGVGGQHAGIDIGTPLGTSITAIQPGTIVAAGQKAWGGDVLEQVNVAGQTIYEQFLHLENINVKVGQQVNPGDVLGSSGGTSTASPIPTSGVYSSGPHLHFAEYTTPLPEQWGFKNTIDPTQLISQLGSGGFATTGLSSTSSSTSNTNCLMTIPFPTGDICVPNPWAGIDFTGYLIRGGLIVFGVLIILIAIGALLHITPEQVAKVAG